MQSGTKFTQANTQMVAGSVAAVARKNGTSIASGFMNVKAFVMVDVSGSMLDRDAPGDMSRYDAACKQLENIQNEQPGKIGVGCFSNKAEFCPSGDPFGKFGTTNMADALRLMLTVDNAGIRLVLISDGEPDDQAETLKIAGKFKSKIDTIFVGREDGRGRKFLQDLSARTGGIAIVNETEKLNLLSDNITKLIGA